MTAKKPARLLNYYATIKSALDASFNAICRHMNVTEKDAHKLVEGHLRSMSKEWRSGQTPNIAYGDPLCRFAYLYCHTAANANLCEIAIREAPDLVSYMEKRCTEEGELKVCAFGGGPGTELLAISKLLINRRAAGPHVRVSFTLLDRVPEWSETWHALEGGIKAELRTHFGPFAKHPFSTSGTFVPFDMTKVQQYGNLATLFCQDLFVLNYVVSEITGNHDQFQELVKVAAAACPTGAKFLIIDRDQDAVIAASKKLLSNAGLSVAKVQRPTSGCMDSDEKPEVLDTYRFNLNWRPRKWWVGTFGSNSNRGAFYLVGTKP
jgi:hypothetical protein